MVLWTIQPRHIWELIQSEGVYICDPAKFSMPEFATQYNWLVEKMAEKIGPHHRESSTLCGLGISRAEKGPSLICVESVGDTAQVTRSTAVSRLIFRMSKCFCQILTRGASS